jgi:hypothetical protein
MVKSRSKISCQRVKKSKKTAARIARGGSREISIGRSRSQGRACNRTISVGCLGH